MKKAKSTKSTRSTKGKSRKKKKQQKRKSLIFLLFLTIIMFGTSTYAWFTANRVVTIEDINVSVQASDGIQISTNAASWKAIITNTDITSGAYSGAGNHLPPTLVAVSSAGQVDTTANSATKGAMKMYKATIENGATDYMITTQDDTEGGSSTTYTTDYVAFDVFLRVNKNQTIYLTSDAKVINKVGETDKGLKNAARVAFVNKGHAEIDETTANLISLNSPSNPAIIWEPNSEAHSTAVVNSVAPDYGVSLATSPVTYYGVNDVLSTATALKPFVATATVAGTAGNTTYLKQMGTSGTTLITTTSNQSTYTQVFQLTAGITKFRIYMWIEGQDIDCENNATGSNIVFKLQLSTESSASS